MKIKSILFGATGIATAGLALLLTQGFSAPAPSQASTATTTATAVQTPSESDTASRATSFPTAQSGTTPNSTTRHNVPLSERIMYADIAAKNAVGGGTVSNLTAGTVQGQAVWKVTISHQGHKTLVVLLQQNNSVLSTKQVG